MALWKKEKVFPIIGDVITKLHRTRGRLIHQREISTGLLAAPAGAKLVGQVQRTRPNKRTPKFEAMAMVAQFSKLYPKSVYEREFARSKVPGGYAYAPRHSGGSKEIPADVLRSLEAELEHRTGFQSNSRTRKAVELCAMRLAEDEMRKRGYEVKNLSATKPYDLFCEKAGKTKYVEVKGTQGKGSEFILTAGEVKFINRNTADCVLCVVHGIKVAGARKPNASGGELQLQEPFSLKTGKLRPIAFNFCRNKRYI